MLKYVVLINPLVYVAERMRGALTPDVPPLPLPAAMAALLAIAALFWTAGLRSFRTRAIG